MTLGHVAFGLALLLGMSLIRMTTLEQRITQLERRTAPLDRICAGSEDDFYEAFFRLVQEECEKKEGTK